MANTKIPIELSSTPSIVDNGDATAITIDSSERVIVGQTAIATGFENFAQLETSHASAGGLVINTQTASTSNYGRLIFTKGNASGNEGLIRYNTGDYHMSFWTAATQRLRLDSDGLKFGSDTAAANALDDYEEGTWTPQITASAGSAGTAAYSNQVGRYTKIGNKVFFEFSVVMTNKGSWSSYTRVLGFPFTTASTGLTAFAVARFPDDTIGAGMVAGELQPSSTYSFFTTGSRLDTLHNISNVDTGYYLVGAGHYTI